MPQQEVISGTSIIRPLPDIEAWLRANSALMISCPRLPGRPRITRETCAHRLALAQEIQRRNGNESLFDGGGPVGLDICLDCPVGNNLARSKAC